MSAGKQLVERIIRDMAALGLEPDTREREQLAVAEGLANQIEALTNTVRAEGYSSRLKSGRVVIHPSVAEIRQASATLSKVLSTIDMGEGLPVNRTKQAAAQARWRAHNEQKRAQQGGA